ncbi:hypothetical protein T265_15820, partial [Opisthorchis viverrini]
MNLQNTENIYHLCQAIHRNSKLKNDSAIDQHVLMTNHNVWFDQTQSVYQGLTNTKKGAVRKL